MARVAPAGRDLRPKWPMTRAAMQELKAILARPRGPLYGRRPASNGRYVRGSAGRGGGPGGLLAAIRAGARAQAGHGGKKPRGEWAPTQVSRLSGRAEMRGAATKNRLWRPVPAPRNLKLQNDRIRGHGRRIAWGENRHAFHIVSPGRALALVGLDARCGGAGPRPSIIRPGAGALDRALSARAATTRQSWRALVGAIPLRQSRPAVHHREQGRAAATTSAPRRWSIRRPTATRCC